MNAGPTIPFAKLKWDTLCESQGMHAQQLKHRAVIHYTMINHSLRSVAEHYKVGESTLARWVKEDVSRPVARLDHYASYFRHARSKWALDRASMGA